MIWIRTQVGQLDFKLNVILSRNIDPGTVIERIVGRVADESHSHREIVYVLKISVAGHQLPLRRKLHLLRVESIWDGRFNIESVALIVNARRLKREETSRNIKLFCCLVDVVEDWSDIIWYELQNMTLLDKNVETLRVFYVEVVLQRKDQLHINTIVIPWYAHVAVYLSILSWIDRDFCKLWNTIDYTIIREFNIIQTMIVQSSHDCPTYVVIPLGSFMWDCYQAHFWNDCKLLNLFLRPEHSGRHVVNRWRMNASYRSIGAVVN